MQSVEYLCSIFSRFQLTVCSYGSSALAELLVDLEFHTIKSVAQLAKDQGRENWAGWSGHVQSYQQKY